MELRKPTAKEIAAANLNQKEKNYWLNKLANRQGKSSFPSYHKKKSDRPMESISTCFTGNTFALIQKVSGGIPQKLQVLLTTAVTALMAKYTNSDDILIGSPIFKQEQDELLVNKILALRTRVKPDASFKELLLETMTTVKEALEHLNYPIGFLQEKLEADTQDDPFTLFDTAIVLEELQERSYLEDVDAFMNMVFSFRLKSDCLEMSIDYRPGVYEPGFIKSLGTHFENLLAAGLGNLDMLLESIEIFSADQMKQLLEGFNDTFRDYPTGKTIHGLFEEQVEKTPDYTAVEFEGKTLTYKELNGKANHLARLLQQNGVVIETVVGIMLEPSPDMMVGLMAILKAGGAYLPIDAGLPAQRVLYMLEDAGAQILLTSRKDAAHIPFTSLLNLTSEREMDIFRTLPRSHIAAFDDLPMADRTLIDPSKYKNKIGMASVADCISIQATRGCPYECVFCHKVWSKKHAFRSADKIFDEVQHYYKQGVRNFAVIDDCFNLSKKNSAEFFQKVIANKLDLQLFFPNGLRGDILTPDYIDLMVEAGTRGINLSLETASPRLQQLIKKYIDIDKFREVMDYIAGTHPNVVLEIATMHGFPTETEDEAKMTLDFIKSIKWLHFPYIHILKIFPNTEMEELALEHGVLKEDILASKDLAFHELPETLPFPKSFTRAYQSDFMNNYFMQKERLEQVLPIQLEVFNEIAVVEKYNAYLPAEINSVGDIVEFAGLEGLELPTGQKKHESIPNIFDREPVEPPPAPAGAKKILFLDLTMHFSSHSMLYNVAEQPIGQIFLLTYLKQQLGDKVDGRIYKSGTDFDAYEELKLLVENYQPDLVAIRSLTFYKEFFHETVSLLRQWGVTAPIFAGGPYATSDYDTILKDHAVDLVVFGEGEYTVLELVERMLENEFKVPAPSVLEGIRGIAYPTAAPEEPISRKIILTDLVGPDEQSPAALPPGSPITSGGNPITSDGNPITSDGSPITSEGNPITSAGNLNVPVTDKNLAYVMYTSGSTGKPKGVMVEHRQVQNCINWMQEKFDLKEKNAIIQRTNLSFDPSVWEIFWPLYLGGKVRVLTEMQRKDAQYLLDIMAEPGDAVMLYCPATLVGAMTYLLNSKREVPDLVLPLLIIGAEPISVETVKNFYSCYQGQIINTYGPTECAINNTYYDISPADMRSFVPIGKPVANNQIYILSQDLKVLPVNVAGEICIAGDSVVRGYVNNKQKTDEVFLDNPFGPGKLYKTGDIGRWLDDGNIEIMGRVDMQVKIRGHRIETGEIEATLGSHSAVEEVVVIARDNKEHLENIIHCKRCGIGSHLPNVRINEDGNCDVCESLGKFKKWMAPYFKDGEKLKEAILELNRGKDTPYDCLLLYSGGRGAGYALYQLVELGLRVLAVTYDNGYFSKKDIANIKMITDSLGVDHISLTHKNTDKILRESMKIAHTVCRGCFHTSASLGVEYAAKHNIPATVGATLSRGQIIENKLFMLNAMGVTDVAEMEEAIKKLALSAIDIDKVIFDLLGIDIVSDKSVYSMVKGFDFYRYYDIPNPDMIEYLNNRHDYWKTRKNYAIYSTNCSIKQIGDYGHLEGAGYHYYGGATSWEKRLGHITLDNLREDLTCSASKQSYDNFVDRVGGLPKELQTDEKYLVAYIVSNKDDLDAAGLRKFLEDKIPSYMIPSYFQQIDEIPLSSNGKLDRKRLPAPEKTQASDAEYIQPETVTEEKLAQVWHEVLALPMEKIGIDDSFFALGGDSIKAIQISARLQAHNLKMDLSQLFANPTIRELAPTIQATDRDIPQGPVEGDVPLTPIQAWFFEKKLSDSHHFNQSVMMYAEKGFVENAVNEALGGIMAHHDALRMSFTPLDVSEGEAESADGEGIPRINRELGIRQQNGGLLSGPIAVEVFDFREQSDCAELIVRECDRIQASMRLDGGAMSGGAGMLRAGLFKTPEGDHILLAVHHLVIDGVSWRIIFEDFAAAYTQCLEGKEITLPPKSDSFQYWAVQLEQYAQEEQFLKELDFWKEMESKEIEPLPRPGGASAPEVRKSKDSVSVAMTLDKELTAQLLTEVNTAFNTEINDLLLTALGMAFSRWSKANGGSGGSVLINLEGHGREDILENINISRTVGWFTSMYPVLLEIETTADLADLIKGTKESLRRIPNKGIGYGVLKYLTPGDKTQEIQFKLKPEIVFNYLGQFDGGEGNGDSSYGMSFMGRGAEVGPESEGSDVFSINGMVSGGQLQMVFGYNRFEYEEEMVSQLSGFYKEALEGIVNFCMGKEDTEYTVSDFDADLDDDDMGDIYDELDIE